DLLHPGGIEDWDHHVDKMEFGLMRGRRGFCGVVIAHQREHTAVLRGPGQIGVAKHVAGAVDPRALAVPHAKDTIEIALAPQFSLLTAPQSGGSEVFVQPGLELDVGSGERAGSSHELLVEPTKRRSAIAGDVTSSIQTCVPVALFLHEARPD